MSHSANLDGIVENEVTGFEFATGRIKPLAFAIQAALQTPSYKALEMGRQGRQRVLGMFDPKDALAAVVNLYDELLKKDQWSGTT